MDISEGLRRRADEYARRNRLALGEQLGYGVHGIVFVVESQTEPGRSAIKIHEREVPYCRERDVYLRLYEHSVTQICGSDVPQLLNYDDELWLIQMTIVSRPYVLDFAGAYLDAPPDFSEEALTDWKAEKQEQFGTRWPKVQAILRSLQNYGVYLADISLNNVGFVD
jgi:hypothetical protein